MQRTLLMVMPVSRTKVWVLSLQPLGLASFLLPTVSLEVRLSTCYHSVRTHMLIAPQRSPKWYQYCLLPVFRALCRKRNIIFCTILSAMAGQDFSWLEAHVRSLISITGMMPTRRRPNSLQPTKPISRVRLPLQLSSTKLSCNA